MTITNTQTLVSTLPVRLQQAEVQIERTAPIDASVEALFAQTSPAGRAVADEILDSLNRAGIHVLNKTDITGRDLDARLGTPGQFENDVKAFGEAAREGALLAEKVLQKESGMEGELSIELFAGTDDPVRGRIENPVLSVRLPDAFFREVFDPRHLAGAIG